MKAAVALYESMGFRRIAAYRENPEGDVVYLEMPLGK
jgi:ribosomal protein S18 acetylase RimI-like enzyme